MLRTVASWLARSLLCVCFVHITNVLLTLLFCCVSDWLIVKSNFANFIFNSQFSRTFKSNHHFHCQQWANAWQIFCLTFYFFLFNLFWLEWLGIVRNKLYSRCGNILQSHKVLRPTPPPARADLFVINSGYLSILSTLLYKCVNEWICWIFGISGQIPRYGGPGMETSSRKILR